jgi:hypothetical protein
MWSGRFAQPGDDVTATLTFRRSALPNALGSPSPMLVDYADMRDADDLSAGASICQPNLQSDQRAAKRDYNDVVGFMHLDDDHCCGSGHSFWLEHALSTGNKGRIKIRELWVREARGCPRAAGWSVHSAHAHR